MKVHLDPEIVDAIEAGKKIQAIKLLRTNTGMSLKEAKSSIDTYIAENGLSEIYKKNRSSGIGFFTFIAALIYFIYWSLKNFS